MLENQFLSLLFGDYISLGVKYEVNFLQTSFSLKKYRKLKKK